MTHPILERLRSPDSDERRDACRDAARDPSAVLLVEALAEVLGDPVKAVGQAASDALAALGREHPSVEPVLRSALRSPDPVRRTRAAFTSARLAPPELRLLPALVEALGSDDGDVRWSASKLLVELGRSTGEVLPVLLHLAGDDPDPVVRRMAIHALRELAPDRPEVAQRLIAASRDPEVRARRAALSALASLVDPPDGVAERLADVIESEPDGACRRIATVALGEVAAQDPARSEAARARLERLCEADRDPDLRRAAARSLARLQKSSASSE